jgi:SAM-dependent methyltransferase
VQNVDAIAQFKQAQKEGWAHFAPLEAITTPVAAHLVQHAGVKPGMRVLDVGCGTGVVAITAAGLGARVTGIDLTPQLLERARENSHTAGLEVDWREADVEELPFGDSQFDVVLSQFAHMFAPRPEVAMSQMLRVIKSGGVIAFSTWPPELLVGRTMALASRYLPPPPQEILSPVLWGDPGVVRQRLGSAVEHVVFDRKCMLVPALSVQHFRANVERTAGPIVAMIERLSATDPDRLRTFRQEFDAIVAQYRRDNIVRQDYLLTRARKV